MEELKVELARQTKLSEKDRNDEVDIIKDEILHLYTLPNRKETSSLQKEEIMKLIQEKRNFELPFEALEKILNSLPIEKWEARLDKINSLELERFKKNLAPHDKYGADLIASGIGINRNRIASGSNRKEIRRREDVLPKLSDPSDNKYITDDLVKEYQIRELDLCGFLDRVRWTNKQIHIMRKIVGELVTIFGLANRAGILIEPVFIGLHRLTNDLKNCTKGCEKNCTRDHDHKKSRKQRKNAQHNLVIELTRIRKRSLKIPSNRDIPSFREYLGIVH